MLVTSRPDPQGPLTAVPSWASWPGAPGRTATASHPDPTICRLAGEVASTVGSGGATAAVGFRSVMSPFSPRKRRRSRCGPESSSSGALTSRTVAPGGTVNVKFKAAGVVKVRLVNPTWRAGVLESRARIWTWRGRPVAETTSITASATRVSVVREARTSS